MIPFNNHRSFTEDQKSVSRARTIKLHNTVHGLFMAYNYMNQNEL